RSPNSSRSPGRPSPRARPARRPPRTRAARPRRSSSCSRAHPSGPNPSSMDSPMRARPQSVVFVCALACWIGVGCTSAEAEAVETKTELAAALAERVRLEAQITELQAKLDANVAELETERGCREQLNNSLSAFAA